MAAKTKKTGTASAVPTEAADLEVIANRTTADLLRFVGGLAKPSKMPGWSYSLPAVECRTGTKLREVEGSVCSGCYAMKGRYRFPNVSAALYRRLAAITKPGWAEAMAELIRRKESSGVFRWHDSGDLQSVDHLRQICRVAEMTPDVRHWLPTREVRILSEFDRAGHVTPPNLNVRVSGTMVGGVVPTFRRLPWVTVSTVAADPADIARSSHECPAPKQENKCGDCRACWDPAVRTVTYRWH